MSDRFFNHWFRKLGTYNEQEKYPANAKPYPMARVRMHSQNLNDRGHRDDEGKYHEEPQGPMWRHGRAWFQWAPKGVTSYREAQAQETEITAEWYFDMRRAQSLALSFDGCPYGDGVRWLFHIAVPWVCGFYFGVSTKAMRARTSQPGSYGFSWTREMNYLQLFWNHKDIYMDSSRETGWRKSWFITDVFFGRTTMDKKVLDTRPVIIYMPEGGYRGVCVMHLDTWKRPRWPWAWHRRTRASIDMDEGQQIPVPGKGENSWDCGDDALFGQTGPADSVEAAIAALRTSAMQKRGKYGGPNWKPRDGWKAAHPV